MSNTYELIAFDMDGTLLDSHKQIAEDTIAAIRTAHQKGKKIVIATGRCMAELKDTLETLQGMASYAITNNGGLVVEVATGKNVFANPIDPDAIQTMLDRVIEDDIMPHIQSDISLVQKDQEAHLADYGMPAYQKLFDDVSIMVDDFRAYYRQFRPAVYKFNWFCRNAELRTKYHQMFLDLPLTMLETEIASLECTVPGGSKGRGLKELCAYLDLPVEQTIAVGDSDNDLAILETAGLAAAMGNANAHVKGIADVILKDNDHGGCAEVIYEYLLKGEKEK